MTVRELVISLVNGCESLDSQIVIEVQERNSENLPTYRNEGEPNRVRSEIVRTDKTCSIVVEASHMKRKKSD